MALLLPEGEGQDAGIKIPGCCSIYLPSPRVRGIYGIDVIPMAYEHMRETILKADAAGEFYTEEGCFILELSNSPEDPDVSIARARVAPGATTRLHRLQGVAERYVILEGTGQVEVGELPVQEVQPGTVVLIPPGCMQRITNTGTCDLVFLAICTPRFTPDVYTDLDAP